jgi:hypothetical protein
MTSDIAGDAFATFDKLDTKKKGKLTAEAIEEYWKGSYAKVYTQVLFREIDLNADGYINKMEWLAYWELVLRSGYSRS